MLVVALFAAGVAGASVHKDKGGAKVAASSSTTTSLAPTTTTTAPPPVTTTTVAASGTGLGTTSTSAVATGRTTMPHTGGAPLALPGLAALVAALATRSVAGRGRRARA